MMPAADQQQHQLQMLFYEPLLRHVQRAATKVQQIWNGQRKTITPYQFKAQEPKHFYSKIQMLMFDAENIS